MRLLRAVTTLLSFRFCDGIVDQAKASQNVAVVDATGKISFSESHFKILPNSGQGSDSLIRTEKGPESFVEAIGDDEDVVAENSSAEETAKDKSAVESRGDINKCQKDIKIIYEECSGHKPCGTNYTEISAVDFRRRRVIGWLYVRPHNWNCQYSHKRECGKCKPCTSKDRIKSSRGLECGTWRDPVCDEPVMLGDCAHDFACMGNVCVKDTLDYKQLKADIAKGRATVANAELEARAAYNAAGVAYDDVKIGIEAADKAATNAEAALRTSVNASTMAIKCSRDGNQSRDKVAQLEREVNEIVSDLKRVGGTGSLADILGSITEVEEGADAEESNAALSTEDKLYEVKSEAELGEDSQHTVRNTAIAYDDEELESHQEIDDSEFFQGDINKCQTDTTHVSEDCSHQNCPTGYQQISEQDNRRRTSLGETLIGFFTASRRRDCYPPSKIRKCAKCKPCRTSTQIRSTFGYDCGTFKDPVCDGNVGPLGDHKGSCPFGHSCTGNLCTKDLDLAETKRQLLESSAVSAEARNISAAAIVIVEDAIAAGLVVTAELTTGSDEASQAALKATSAETTANRSIAQQTRLHTRLANVTNIISNIKSVVTQAGSLEEIEQLEVLDIAEDEDSEVDAAKLEEDELELGAIIGRDDAVDAEDFNVSTEQSQGEVAGGDITKCERDIRIIYEPCAQRSCASGETQIEKSNYRRRRWTLCGADVSERLTCAKCKNCRSAQSIREKYGTNCGDFHDSQCDRVVNLGICGTDSKCEDNVCLKLSLTFADTNRLIGKMSKAGNAAYDDAVVAREMAETVGAEARAEVAEAEQANTDSFTAAAQAATAMSRAKACAAAAPALDAKIVSVRTAVNKLKASLKLVKT